jgi:hypothetical protein
MALIPLNTFKTKTSVLGSDTSSTVYVAPIGVTSIVLMAQVSNITTQTQYVTFSHYRNLPVLADAQGNGGQMSNVATELVKEFPIPASDSGSMTSGKMIIESLDSIRCYATTTGTCKLVLSILETANA